MALRSPSMASMQARRKKAYDNMRGGHPNDGDSLPSREETNQLNTRVDEMQNAENERQKKAREGYKQEAMADIQTPMEGISPKDRVAMQELASNQINSQLGNYSRMLSSQAGARGMRGGAANALQTELQQQGLQASNAFNQELSQKNYDAQMQKLAGYLSMIEGRGANDILTRQQYIDYLTGEKEKKRQGSETSYYNKYFSKV